MLRCLFLLQTPSCLPWTPSLTPWCWWKMVTMTSKKTFSKSTPSQTRPSRGSSRYCGPPPTAHWNSSVSSVSWLNDTGLRASGGHPRAADPKPAVSFKPNSSSSASTIGGSTPALLFLPWRSGWRPLSMSLMSSVRAARLRWMRWNRFSPSLKWRRKKISRRVRRFLAKSKFDLFCLWPFEGNRVVSRAVKSGLFFFSIFIWSFFFSFFYLAFLLCSNSVFYVCVGVLLIVRMNYFHTLFAVHSAEEPDAKKAKEHDGEEDYSLADIAEGSVTSVSIFSRGSWLA